MTGIILVCRMSSSRLPGKTLMPFGETSLLEHIVRRIEAGGIAREHIVVCTSTAEDDAVILRSAESLGCGAFAGSLNNVSLRILDAASAYGMERFSLVLGDNPWVDPGQVRDVQALAAARPYDYIVTATPELPYRPADERYYPIGTRIQNIRRAFMEERLAALDSAEVREHTSLLFKNLQSGIRTAVCFPPDGIARDDLGMLNISINTREDYDRAVAVLDKAGDPLLPAREITEIYRAA